MSIVFVAAVAALPAGVGWVSSPIFGHAPGAWVTIGIGLIAYAALKLYTDRQERLLRSELEQMTPEQQADFLAAAKRKGLIPDEDP